MEQNFFTLETSCIDFVSSMGASHGLTSLPAICTARHSPYVFLQTKVCCQKMKLWGFISFLTSFKEILFFTRKFYLEQESKLVHIDIFTVFCVFLAPNRKKNKEMNNTYWSGGFYRMKEAFDSLLSLTKDVYCSIYCFLILLVCRWL